MGTRRSRGQKVRVVEGIRRDRIGPNKIFGVIGPTERPHYHATIVRAGRREHVAIRAADGGPARSTAGPRSTDGYVADATTMIR